MKLESTFPTLIAAEAASVTRIANHIPCCRLRSSQFYLEQACSFVQAREFANCKPELGSACATATTAWE